MKKDWRFFRLLRFFVLFIHSFGWYLLILKAVSCHITFWGLGGKVQCREPPRTAMAIRQPFRRWISSNNLSPEAVHYNLFHQVLSVKPIYWWELSELLHPMKSGANPSVKVMQDGRHNVCFLDGAWFSLFSDSLLWSWTNSSHIPWIKAGSQCISATIPHNDANYQTFVVLNVPYDYVCVSFPERDVQGGAFFLAGVGGCYGNGSTCLDTAREVRPHPGIKLVNSLFRADGVMDIGHAIAMEFLSWIRSGLFISRPRISNISWPLDRAVGTDHEYSYLQSILENCITAIGTIASCYVRLLSGMGLLTADGYADIKIFETRGAFRQA